MNKIDFGSINVVPSSTLVVVSSFNITADEEGNPSKIILNVCIDPEKAGTEGVEIPVFLPAFPSFESLDHYAMLSRFRHGDPFVAVECDELTIYRNPETNHIFGTARSFTTVQDFSRWEDIIND